METEGRAYGFFDSKLSKERIEAELPSIRNVARAPSVLELSLIEGVERLRGELALMPIVGGAKEAGIRYVLKATYPGGTNRKTADEVADILNQVYQLPLHQDGEHVRWEGVYKDRGRYVFRD